MKFDTRPDLVGLLLVFLWWSAPAMAWEGTVTKVLDGDSFRVRKGDELVTLRLYGIDCPEYGQAQWREAKEAARDMVQGKKVNVKPIEMDRYGRVVALVDYRGQQVNSELVRHGMAWVYPHYCKAQPLCRALEELEQGARSQQLGIWKEYRPVPPWVWKHSNR
jgi:micrococcal nuclease